MAGVPFTSGVEKDIGEIPVLTLNSLLTLLSRLGIFDREAVFSKIMVEVFIIIDDGSGKGSDQRVLFYSLCINGDSNNEKENK